VHAGAHRLDQFPDFSAANFRDAQRAGALPKHGIAGLDNFKFCGAHDSCSRAGGMRALLSFVSFSEDIREGLRDKRKSARAENI
jgi:hypothetical protein